MASLFYFTTLAMVNLNRAGSSLFFTLQVKPCDFAHSNDSATQNTQVFDDHAATSGQIRKPRLCIARSIFDIIVTWQKGVGACGKLNRRSTDHAFKCMIKMGVICKTKVAGRFFR